MEESLPVEQFNTIEPFASAAPVHATLPLLSEDRSGLPVQAREDQRHVATAPPGQKFPLRPSPYRPQVRLEARWSPSNSQAPNISAHG